MGFGGFSIYVVYTMLDEHHVTDVIMRALDVRAPSFSTLSSDEGRNTILQHCLRRLNIEAASVF